MFTVNYPPPTPPPPRPRGLSFSAPTTEVSSKRYYDEFCQNFMSLFSGPMTMYHVQPRPGPPGLVLSKASAPITEIGIAYFPPDMSDGDQEQWVRLNEDYARDIMSRAEGFLAYSGGMVLEPQGHPSLGPTKAYFGAWAWASKEARQKAAETDDWDRLTKEIQEFPGLRSIAKVHVDLLDVLPLSTS